MLLVYLSEWVSDAVTLGLPWLPYSLVTVWCHKTGLHGVIPRQLACEHYVASSHEGLCVCNECFLWGMGALHTTEMSAIFM